MKRKALGRTPLDHTAACEIRRFMAAAHEAAPIKTTSALRRFTLSRAISLFLLPLSALQGLFFAIGPFGGRGAWPWIALCTAAAIVAAIALAKPRVVWLAIGLGGAVCAAFFSVPYAHEAGPRTALAESAIALSYAAIGLVAVLSLLGLAPAKASALAASLAIALTCAMGYFTWKQRASAWPVPICVFSQGMARHDPQRGYVVTPGARSQDFYPDNPRGYFDRVESWNLPVGTLQQQRLDFRNGTKAVLVPVEASPEVKRVEITTASSKEPWNVQLLSTQCDLVAGRRYVLFYRARAEAPRKISWTIVRPGKPPLNYAPFSNVSLWPEWREFYQQFEAQATGSDGLLTFNLADSTETVEFDQVVLAEAPERLESDKAPGRFAVSYQYNQRGFRERDYAVPRPEGVFRIVVLGDSVTFGQGVRVEHTFAKRLEAALNRRRQTYPDLPSFEVVNCALCGYSTREERACYEHAAREYQPNLVLLVMFSNDYEDSGQQQRQRRSRFGALGTVGRQVGQVVGPDYHACVDEIDALAKQCATDGASLAVAVFRYGPHDKLWNNLLGTLGKRLKEQGPPWIDLGEPILEHLQPELATVHPLDGHPNEVAHAEAAMALESFLDKHQFLPAPSATAEAASQLQRGGNSAHQVP